MSWISMLFGFRGHIDRTPFGVGLVSVAAVFWAGLAAAEAALPLMARVLAPRGINAGLALNVIWSLLWLLAVGSALALVAKRLHARGRSGWWGVAAIVPLAALAQINDAIFLLSRKFAPPSVVQYAVLVAAGAIALWVLYECVVARERES